MIQYVCKRMYVSACRVWFLAAGASIFQGTRRTEPANPSSLGDSSLVRNFIEQCFVDQLRSVDRANDFLRGTGKFDKQSNPLTGFSHPA